MTLHVFTVRRQPATRYLVDPLGDGGIWIRNKPRTLLRTVCCKRLRVAANVAVQVYYDGVYASCRPGAGCKKGKR